MGKTVDGLGGFAARAGKYTVKTVDDLELFRQLADRNDFQALTSLCRERLLTARNPQDSLRWTKDRAIVEAIQANYTGAYDLLAGVHFFATQAEGRTRGRYENEFGLVLARLGRSSLALERFGLAYQISRREADMHACATVDHNRARALFTRGETAKAMRYVKRAMDYARANNDYRLEMEICQTVIEMGGAV